MPQLLDRGRILSPDDVFRSPARWREVSRVEALAAQRTDRIVAVFRNGSHECAAWFEPGLPMYGAVGPFPLRAVRYYRRVRIHAYVPMQVASAVVTPPDLEPSP